MIKKYINEILGIDIEISEFKNKKKLPLYLLEEMEIFSFTLLCQKGVLIKPKDNKCNIKRLKNQLSKFIKEEGIVIFVFNILTSYQRKFLIQNKINFIVPMSQCYLPFVGVSLKESLLNEINKRQKLSSNAQLILLYMIYNQKSKYYSQSLIEETKLQAISVSRGLNELESFGLITSYRESKERYSVPKEYGKNLYLRAKDLIISPVAERVFLKISACKDTYIKAGESALADVSLLGSPKIDVYAADKKEKGLININDIIDPNWYDDKYIELEIWNYNPVINSVNNVVDIISLRASLSHLNDERIEKELEIIMNKGNLISGTSIEEKGQVIK